MKSWKSKKGSVTIFVLMACLFFVAFLIGVSTLISARRQAQIQATREMEKTYSQGNKEDSYDNFFGGKEVPIYNIEQFFKIGSGETIAISEEQGKMYVFSTDSVYVVKQEIKAEYNGVWETPSLTNGGRIEGVDKITVQDLSKPGEVYYYFIPLGNYQCATNAEGYTYKGNLSLFYDGKNNTGSGTSKTTTTWKDLSGNNNDGTLNGFTTTAATSDWTEDGLKFATNKYVQTNSQTGIYGTSMTVEVTCERSNVTIPGTYASLISRTNGSGSVLHDNYNLSIYKTNTIFRSRVGIGGTLEHSTISNNVNMAGKKYSYTMSFSYNSGTNTTTVNVYVDGQKSFSSQATGSAYVDSNFVTRIGCFYTGMFFDGIINEVRIYNRALSDVEINQNSIVNLLKYST